MPVSKKVLVIEDDDDMRAMLTHLLPLWGLEAIAAPDGIAGLDMARRDRPDLIVCDVYMPYLSGWEVAIRLQADASLACIPLIFLSSATDSEMDSERMRRAGVRSFITKGDFRMLRHALHDLLEPTEPAEDQPDSPLPSI